ncbi:MAG: transposase [Myxococcales bacterium]|nr:transposase [Myxococcales bacterium]
MTIQYSERFKARMVERMLRRGGPSAYALSQEVGVSQPTLSRWKREAAIVARVSADEEEQAERVERRPEDWSPREKLKAVMEAAALDDADLGAWLRREGLKEEYLRQWRATLADRAAAVFGSQSKPDAAARKELKRLEKELQRKEKALAETAALLVLQGKVQALWAEKGADTRPMSDTPSSLPLKRRKRKERG